MVSQHSIARTRKGTGPALGSFSKMKHRRLYWTLLGELLPMLCPRASMDWTIATLRSCLMPSLSLKAPILSYLDVNHWTQRTKSLQIDNHSPVASASKARLVALRVELSIKGVYAHESRDE